ALAALLVAAAPARADSILSPRVTLDHYSVIVKGKRVVVNAGELHPFRLPAMLDKMRAAGLNTVSIYIPWSLHEPAPGRFRFDGRFDVERFLREARDA